MKAIDFTVVVPTFRRPDQLREAISSVLGQREAEIEIIVVDDSPERSAEAVVASVGDARVTYLANPKPSGGFPSAVRNLGWPIGRGDFVHFLDDDDIIPPGHYATVKEAFAKNPNVGVVFSRIDPFGDCSPSQLQHEKRYFNRAARLAMFCERFRSRRVFVACLMFHWALLVCSAVMLRRRCLEQLGGFDAQLRLREDIDLYARAMRQFDVCFLDRVGLKYRIGNPSLMHAPELTQLDLDDLHVAQHLTNARYKSTWGSFEFYALKLFARAIFIFV
ncbi:glycosyltransferase family 2 protein [Bradyrhizobium rifense]|uniref:Glycosyltransferase family 2 protein n=1 Tax=Bradyrhizobium rifense TaxID=515499 RepID=A0A5D3KBN7_9BRAD|nr:glycosyltransferase family 2 protein [Bradyrhizobium rifense]TYL92017.1 glycosyltransferase family 2 protein [Bradyrhizobium rifense]